MLSFVSIDNSGSDALPVVFLHGFGGLAAQWQAMQMRVSYKAPTYAFDLPGHGKSLDYPGFGPPKVAAKAVLAEMTKLDFDKFHLVGHSMGGAVSSLIALISPASVASLTLLAPGGYGEEFNHPFLLEWGAASTIEELSELLPQLFGEGYDKLDKVAAFHEEARSVPGAVDALSSIAKAMSSDGKQGVLPVADILAADYPIKVFWGTEDKILPVSQAEKIAHMADVTILDGVGHSPAEEARDTVLEAIFDQIST